MQNQGTFPLPVTAGSLCWLPVACALRSYYPFLQVFHPNIDLEGNVCLNILREDWKPVLSINSVIYGLQFLFMASPFPPFYQHMTL